MQYNKNDRYAMKAERQAKALAKKARKGELSEDQQKSLRESKRVVENLLKEEEVGTN
jgi:hypothetical protein